MQIISGRINTSLDGISEIISKRNEQALVHIAKGQIALGAQAIDLNCATHLNTEIDDMIWMIKTLQSNVDIALGTDSPNPDLHKEALKIIRAPRPIVNSISLELHRVQDLAPHIKENDARLVVLLHDETGMPKTSEDRIRILPKVEKLMRDYKLDFSDVFLDPLLFPIAFDEQSAVSFIQTIVSIKKLEPRFRFICGMDNISYTMPEIEILNIAMMFMLAGNDMDAVMLSLTPKNASFIPALHALTAQSEGVINYLKFYRQKRLNILNNSAELEDAWLRSMN